MKCPVCEQVMREIKTGNEEVKIDWCGRCGTIKSDSRFETSQSVPRLVWHHKKQRPETWQGL